MPVTKKAEANVDWSDGEMKELLSAMKAGEDATQARDSTSYYIDYDNTRIKIDWDKIPLKYRQAFEKMKDQLQIVKP